MSKQFKTGLAKNVAHLQKLIQQVATYPEYNPSVDNVTLASLNTLYATAQTIINDIENKRIANKQAIHNRQEAYKNLNPLSTRIINHLEILGLTQGILDQAKSLNHLIQGASRKKTTIATNPTQITKT